MNEDFHGEILFRFYPIPKMHPHEDQAEEYVIVSNPDAASGLIVYAKYRGEWDANPFTDRPVIRWLIAQWNADKARAAKFEAALEHMVKYGIYEDVREFAKNALA